MVFRTHVMCIRSCIGEILHISDQYLTVSTTYFINIYVILTISSVYFEKETRNDKDQLQLLEFCFKTSPSVSFHEQQERDRLLVTDCKELTEHCRGVSSLEPHVVISAMYHIHLHFFVL